MRFLTSFTSIGSYLVGRSNNFNLLRLVAAVMVIWSHSWALLPNGLASDPLVRSIGMGWAGIAVNAFFAISGFLIVRSYITHDSLRVYLQARVLRIMPGLSVAVLFCVFFVGLLHTTLSYAEYFSSDKVWRFLYSNIAMYNRHPWLPGVFLDNSTRGINGSLWTLSFEVSMYLAVAAIGVLGLLKSRRGIAFVCIAYVAYYLFTVLYPELAKEWLTRDTQKYQRLSLYFFLGGCCYVFRERIPLNVALAAFLWLMSYFAFGSPYFKFVFSFALTYSVLWLAFVPAGWIRQFNAVDDYSYGMYIYAFPVQQMLIMHISGIGEQWLFLLSTAVTFVFAYLSWKLVERPALGLNSRLTRDFYGRRKSRLAP